MNEPITSRAQVASQGSSPAVASVDFDPFAFEELQGTAPATEPQREIWAATQLGPEASASYNLPAALRIRGELDVSALETCLQQMIARHDSLRMSFTPDGETLCFARQLAVPLRMDPANEDDIDGIFEEEGTAPFDLVKGPLVRFRLLRFSERENLLIVTIHHVAWDGWSIGVFFRELLELYAASCGPPAAGLPAAPSFRDYAMSLASAQHRELRSSQESAWVNRLSGMPEYLQLPTDKLRPPLRTFRAGCVRHRFSTDARIALERLATTSGSTLFISLASAFFAYLHRLTGQERIVVGIPAAGQVNAASPGLIGHCVSMLPMPSRFVPGMSFMEFLRETRNTVLDATEDRDCSFGKIVERLNLVRDVSTVPLVQAVFNLDRATPLPDVRGLECSLRMPPKPFENFEWFVNAVDGGESLDMECTFKRDLFDERAMRDRFRELETLIVAAARNPDRPVTQLDLASGRQAVIDVQETTARLHGSEMIPEEARLSVVDGNGQPAPIGVPGELVFRMKACRLFCYTGKRARIDVDGRLQVLSERLEWNGRAIEAADIESLLCENGAAEAVLLAQGAEGRLQLSAHIVPAAGVSRDAAGFERLLARSLPPWALPEHIHIHEQLPRAPDGNIDSPALAQIWPNDSAHEVSCENGVVEEILARIWQDVLGCAKIGCNDDFFELGGHSLLASRIVARLRTDFHVDLPMTAIFLAPTIARLAKRDELKPLATLASGSVAKEEFEL